MARRKRYLLKAVFAGLAILLIRNPEKGMAQFARCQGRDIVAGNGSVLLLKGVGLGGWLVPEGYMLHVPGFGSPTDIQAKIEGLLGTADADIFWDLYQYFYVNERDIRRIAEWGFNSVRLPFNYRMLSPEDQPSVFIEKGFAVFDSVSAWCRRNALYLILDMHCAPGGHNAGNISDSDGTARLWTESPNQDRTVAIWQVIAERYAQDTTILGYDLLNEPVLPSGVTNLDLRNLYRRLADSIRTRDPNHILFIEGSDWGNNFDNLSPPGLFGTNVAYSFHKYWNAVTLASIQSFLQLRTTYNVPLWLGEFGENSNAWFYEVRRLCEENQVGWNFWLPKKIATVTSPFSAPLRPAYQAVLDYWNGRAGRPTQAAARNALFEMAKCLDIDSCEYHPDVVAALLDADYGVQSRPYRDHHIPGDIPAPEYDTGAPLVAFYDQGQTMRDDYSEGSAWNSGWEFRNDAVDIGEISDGVYYVGWTGNGEWFKITFVADSGGQYELGVWVASPGSSGQFAIILDGQPWTGMKTVTSTGGWAAWKRLSISGLSVSQGTHVLTFSVLTEGFNVRSLDFVFQGSGCPDGSGSGTPKEWKLGQNFPNPFNLSTTIPLCVGSEAAGRLHLAIFSMKGEQVITIADASVSSGSHSFTWDGRDERNRTVGSGIYFCRAEMGPEIQVKPLVLLK